MFSFLLLAALFPLFSRVVTPDDEQAAALVSIARHFGWSKLVSVSVDDSYGQGFVSALHAAGTRAELEAQRNGAKRIADLNERK